MANGNQYGQLAARGAPVTMGPAGFWLDDQGNVAATDPSGAPQVTPGAQGTAAAGIGSIQVDDQGRHFLMVQGKKTYISPAAYGGTAPKGGGVFHTAPAWNTETGQWESGLDWGNILSLVIAGTMTAGVATAALGGTPAAEAAVSTAASTGDINAGITAATSLGADIPAATTGVATTGIGTTAATAPTLAGATVPAAASAIPAATAPAASSAPSWLGPVVGTGISTAGSLIGAGMQAGATKDAAALNQKYLEDALAYEKERDAYARTTEANRYGTLLSETAPYVATGQAAGRNMAGFLGLPAPAAAPPAAAPAPTPAGAPPYIGTPGTPGQGGTIGQTLTPRNPNMVNTASPGAPPSWRTPPTAPGQMVTMRAPDGSTKQVPAAEVDHWTARGAQVVS